jgi:hypothetical protein
MPEKRDEMMERFLATVGDAYENTSRLRFD